MQIHKEEKQSLEIANFNPPKTSFTAREERERKTERLLGLRMEIGIRENMMMVVVVEYLGDSMAKDLLCKFPDYSAFDFDYSQSSLWSPLRKLASKDHDDEDKDEDGEEEQDEGLLLVNAFKRVTGNLKKKIVTGTQGFQGKIHSINSQYDKMVKQRKKNMKKKIAAFDFSPKPVSGSTPRKGWNKLLKVACKRFKKATKKKDPQSLISSLIS